MSLINLWLERLERSMTGKRRRRRAKRLFMRGNNLMAKRHSKSKWCSKGAFLCKNPQHYTWDALQDVSLLHSTGIKGVMFLEYWTPARARIVAQNDGSGFTDEDALQKVVEGAFLSGDRACYKALCILAFNNPDYFQWQKPCLANYERIVNSPIPNRKLKRQI